MGLNLFDDCAAECVHLCPQEEECTFSSWGDSKMKTPGTIANSQTDMMSTKRNNDGAVAKVRVLVELRDTIRHLKTFRVFSNEMPVFLLILC